MAETLLNPELDLVVGVDFSEGAVAAVNEAKRLASWLDEELAFVHVVDDQGDAPRPVDVGAWLRALSLDRAAIRVVRGVAWIELSRAAMETSSRLLVVGSHGRSGFQPLKPGRTASRLMLRSPVPVVVVPGGGRTASGGASEVNVVERVPEGFRRLDGTVGAIRESLQ